ncbi:MAG: hypothetical protein A2161_18435 [Candidatus Schekmanbacteria bacterium RBG_13_48_7]|uniref:Outer membrane protein beta-barrel domain-containing protein n=1 Tax=Candidatus Schekmanbacteria bacterium RBG_13_48_7 TaxID=1817878 RepID=A0A1F7RPI6_9BACT|nr:MAG: hypothetical protein A2161_18435 [Candidatus Schekmanbacteria bacterium RBG_13_48_7]
MKRKFVFITLIFNLFVCFRVSYAHSEEQLKNEIFVYLGATQISHDWSTNLYGITFGHYFSRIVEIEFGFEHYGDSGSSYGGTWTSLNFIFDPHLSKRFRPYILAGIDLPIWPEFGAGMKIYLQRHFAARCEYTNFYDDDEGWTGNFRAGMIVVM